MEIRNYGQGSSEIVTRHADATVREVNGTQSLLARDHLASVLLVTDATGLAARTTSYIPYGEIADETVLNAAVETESKGFIGERYDADAGLQYLNARYYDPALGLFIQPDWFEVTMRGVGTNRYMYSGGDPVNGSDPGGNVTYNPGGSTSTGLNNQGLPNETYTSWTDRNSSNYGNYSTVDSPAAKFNNGPHFGISVKTGGDGRRDPGDEVQTFGSAFGMAGQSSLDFDIALSVGGAARVAWSELEAGWAGIKSAASSGVWNLTPTTRGQVIEQMLGQNLPRNFPVIDRWVNGVATSIKSLDLNAATYQNMTRLSQRLTGYIDKVAGFQGRTWAGVQVRGVTGRVLELVVPNSGSAVQQSVINQAVQYGASLPRKVIVNVIKMP